MYTPRRQVRRHLTAVIAGLLGMSSLAAAGLTLGSGPAAAGTGPTVALAVPSTIYLGQTVSYKLTATAGATDATAVTVTDAIPADLTYQAVDNPAWACNTTSGLSCALTGTLTANTDSVVTVTLVLSATSVLPSVSFNPQFTDALAEAASLGAPVAATVAPDADLSLTKTVTSAPAANPVTYDLKVSNAGPSTATAPVVTDTLPAGLVFGSGANCVASAATITCTAPADLASGASVTFSISANGTVPVTTGASVASPTFDPLLANNTAPAPSAAPPAPAVSPATLPAGDGTDPGPCGAAVANVRTCNLVAAPGTITVQNVASPIPIWGFNIDPGDNTTPPGLEPGPTLIAVEGETLQLHLRNALPTNPSGTDHNLLAVVIPGLQTSHTDDTGIPTGSSTTLGDPAYTWTNLPAGTYTYEAGQTSDGARQLAMGLSGLLIVRPKGFSATAMSLQDLPTSPTGNACTATPSNSGFTAEATVELDELSSDFHAAPWTSVLSPGGGTGPIATQGLNDTPGGSADIAFYAPDVFLINGKAYPDTETVTVNATDCVALHYANLGMLEKSIGVVGRREIVMASDGFALAHPQNLATRYINPGETDDVVVDMTGSAPGATYPVMDLGRHLNNGDGTGNGTDATNTGMTLGGQLALIQVAGTGAAATSPAIDKVGLDHTTVAAPTTPSSPTPTTLLLTAHGSAGVTGGEYSIDAILPPGTATGANDVLSGHTIDTTTAAFSGLSNGDHIIWVRVTDGTHWSHPAGVVFTYDSITNAGPKPAVSDCKDASADGGPILCNLSLDPSITNGLTPNHVAGAVDPNTGVPAVSRDLVIDGSIIPPLPDWTITGFYWDVDGHGFTYVDLPGNDAGATVELNTAIPQATLQGYHLTQGTHTVTVHAVETQGASTRTSADVTLPLTWIDPIAGGPSTSIDKVTPTVAGPASDNLANLNYNPSVRIDGTFTDTLAPVTGGEMIFAPLTDYLGHAIAPPNPPTADGTGIEVVPDGGIWNIAPTIANGGKVPYFVEIPSVEFNGMAQGSFEVFVHGRDQAGQWGPWHSQVVNLDKTPPTVTAGFNATAPRTDTGFFFITVRVRAGNPFVRDFFIRNSDVGQPVSGTGIPAGAVIGPISGVGLNRGFTILVGGVPTAATANAAAVTVGTYALNLTAADPATVPPCNGRVDTPVTISTTSPFVRDAAIQAGDLGKTVTGAGIPANAVIFGVVTTGAPATHGFTIRVAGVNTNGLVNTAAGTITIGNPGKPVGCGGVAVQSKVVAVEWTISTVDVADNPAQDDFTVFLGGPGGVVTGANPGGLLPAPTNGPVALRLDISGGPQPYTAPASVNFRVMDGAGNWSDWYTANIPNVPGAAAAGD